MKCLRTVISGCISMLVAAVVHCAEPEKNNPIYVRKATWHESMRASLEATFAPAECRDKAAGSEGFRPAVVRLDAAAKPVRLDFCVRGLERVYFAAPGVRNVAGAVSFLNPRLLDARGAAVELDIGSPLRDGSVGAKSAAKAELKLDGVSRQGFSLNVDEIAFKLDGKYERLEVLVVYNAEKGMPSCAAVDSRPVLAAAEVRRQVWEALWDLVAKDFRDRQSQIEMEMERRDGIWNEYSTTGAEATDAYYFACARQRLELARKTLELVQRTGQRKEMAAELEALGRQLESAVKTPGTLRGRDCFAKAVDLRRRILFSHPALGFERLLLSKRPPAPFSAPGDLYFGMHSGVGPGLVLLDNWKSERPKETVLLDGKLPPGCAMHADLSFDGKRVVFAYADHSVAEKNKRQFFLYEINVDGTGLRQVTGRKNDPLTGAHGRTSVICEDYDPCYLPDGGFAFISTRNQGGVRCHDGGRYCPTYVLYRCEGDGSNIRQISFNEASEWDPTVLSDGRLIWSRWDYINRPVLPTQGLWTTGADGTRAAHFYGNYTRNPCMVCQPRQIPGSRKVVATVNGHHTLHVGSLIIIDRDKGEDGLDPITRLTPEATFPETEPTSPVSFGDAYPLSEDLFLAEFSPDPLPSSMSHRVRNNAFGIYLVDTLGGRELVYRDPAICCFEPLPIQARQVPRVASLLAGDGVKPATGVFYMQDAYKSTQGIPPGTIKRLRVNEIITQPTQRVPYSSVVRYEVLKRVVGTVPVDENGSVAFEAPACVPLQFQALDENGMAVMTMRTTTYLQPGEQAGCVGCHESRTSSPVNQRPQVASLPVRKLEPPVGPQYEGGFSFAKTVQPVLDRYCIGCHGLKEPAAKMNLLGKISIPEEKDLVGTAHRLVPSVSYAALTQNGVLVKIAQYFLETISSKPKDYFAHAGTLAGKLKSGHQKISLDSESFQRIIDWLDLNAQFYGTYSWNKDEWRRPDPAGEQALRARIREKFGEELAGQPFEALVNVALPSESRILKAPLAVAAGGWGQIEKGGWKSCDDPDYRKMCELVGGAVRPLPYHDIAGTCGRKENCLCLSCWVRNIMEQRPSHIAASR